MNDPIAAAGPYAAPRPTHPVWAIACKEITDLWRDARWRALLAVTLLLTAAALVLGGLRVERLARQQAQAAAGDRAVWTAQGQRDPHAAAHFGQYAFKPVGPLAVAEPGVDAYLGGTIWLEAHNQNQGLFRGARDGTLAARMGQLTLSFVLQTVMPLIAILLGFAAVSGEREQGTLQQLIGLGVRPLHLLAGKAAAGALVLMTLVATAAAGLAIGLAVVGPSGVGGHASGGPGPGWRLAGMAAVYALYLLGFLALALAVSSIVRSSRAALVVLFGFWLLNSFVVPRWAGDIVSRTDPLPSAQALQQAIGKDKRELFAASERHPAFVALRERALREYGVPRVEDLPVSFQGLAARADDEAGYVVHDRHNGRLQARIEAQDGRRARGGFLFPMLALQPLSTALAGTDNRHHHHFVQAAERHRRRIQTAVSQDIIDHAKGREDSYAAPPDLWQRIPALDYHPPGARWALRDQGSNALALGCWCLAAAAAALWAARRVRGL